MAWLKYIRIELELNPLALIVMTTGHCENKRIARNWWLGSFQTDPSKLIKDIAYLSFEENNAITPYNKVLCTNSGFTITSAELLRN